MSVTIESILADAQKFAGMVQPVFALLALTVSVTGIGGPAAPVAIKILQAAVQAIAAGAEGKITAEQVMVELDKLKALTAKDAAADAALAARFPG